MIPILYWVPRWKTYVNLGIIIKLKPTVVLVLFSYKKKKQFKSKAYWCFIKPCFWFLKFMVCIACAKHNFILSTEVKKNKNYANVFLGLLACHTRLLANTGVDMTKREVWREENIRKKFDTCKRYSIWINVFKSRVFILNSHSLCEELSSCLANDLEETLVFNRKMKWRAITALGHESP